MLINNKTNILFTKINILAINEKASYNFMYCKYRLYYYKCKTKAKKSKNKNSSVEHIDSQTFREKVFDYKNNKHWRYKGKQPLLIDFYASWCGPCKMVAPILEELQVEYGHSLQIYKVNVMKETELKYVFRVSALPTFLYIPLNDKPTLVKGALSKEVFIKSIEDILHVKHPSKKSFFKKWFKKSFFKK